MSKEQEKLEAINYELGAMIQWLEDRISYIEESVGIPFGLEYYQEMLSKLVLVRRGNYPNLENIFRFHDAKVSKLLDRIDRLEEEPIKESMKSDTIKAAILLIQEGRTLALQGEYGSRDLEYTDVRERFDAAINLLQKLVNDSDNNASPITKE